MESLPRCLHCCMAMVLVLISQALAFEPASTHVHKGGYLKSNANTRVPITSHQRWKRQATGSRISYTEAQSLVDKHNIRRRNETASDMEFMVSSITSFSYLSLFISKITYVRHVQPRKKHQNFTINKE